MIHLMIDPNSASEFCSTNTKGSNDKLFPAEQLSARKRSFSYMADGRKLVNGHLESCTSPDKLWQDTLIRGQIIHHVHETSATDHLSGTVGPTSPCTLGKDPTETTADDSGSAKVCSQTRNHQTFNKHSDQEQSTKENKLHHSSDQ